MKKKFSLSERVDDFIGFFAPATAYRRAAFRQARGMQKQLSAYTAAGKGRLRGEWIARGKSADDDILPELPVLRARSRDLIRNDAHACGITATITTNVVANGIKPQSRIDEKALGIPREKADDAQRQCEKVWERWEPHADAGERLDIYEIQALVDRQILENGEVIVMPVMINEPGRPYSLALDIIEADRLVTPSDKKSDKSIRHGIQLGERGQPKGYWIRKGSPKNSSLRLAYGSDQFAYVKAKNKFGRPNIFHLYPVQRPGQSRGVPFFAPVMTYFKDLAQYLEAELIAARITACFALFVTKENAMEAAIARSTPEGDGSGKRRESIEPGIIDYLNPGESVQSFSPQRPGGSFEPFVDRILRAISTALNLPYEIVAKDFSKTNYSSARAALLEARRFFKTRQEFLVRKLCMPIWALLIEEAYLRGEIDAPNFYAQQVEWARSRWITPGWQHVDPAKEAKATKELLNTGITSLADEAAAQGKNWEEIIEQRAREKEKIKKLEEEKGIKILGEPSKEEKEDEKIEATIEEKIEEKDEEKR